MESKPKILALKWQVDGDAVDRHVSVLDLIANQSDLSRAQIKLAMSSGAVWRLPAQSKRAVRVRRKAAKFSAGDTLFLYFNSEYLETQPLVPVLIEDCQDFSVWDKPSGMRVVGSKWGDHLSLNYLIEKSLGDRKTYIVHRLDQWASGLIIVAHKKKVTAELARCFEQRLVTKRYRALVESPLPRDLPVVVDDEINGKPALTRILAQGPANGWLNCRHGESANTSINNAQALLIEIETGRKHQIRKHCLALGRPILGDRRYSLNPALDSTLDAKESGDCCDLQLRSVQLGLKWRDQDYFWRLDESSE